MLRGGYQIIDLEGRNFVAVADGVEDVKWYEPFDSKIKSGKALLISGVRINNIDYNSFYMTVGNNARYYGVQPNSDKFTFGLNYYEHTYSVIVHNNGKVVVRRER